MKVAVIWHHISWSQYCGYDLLCTIQGVSPGNVQSDKKDDHLGQKLITYKQLCMSESWGLLEQDTSQSSFNS